MDFDFTQINDAEIYISVWHLIKALIYTIKELSGIDFFRGAARIFCHGWVQVKIYKIAYDRQIVERQ